MLSHISAGFHLGLLRYPPPNGIVHVSTPRRVGSRAWVVVHPLRPLPRIVHQGIPTTSLPQTTVDIASLGQLRPVRRAISELDFRRLYDPDRLVALCGSGVRGTRLMTDAIARHHPGFHRLNDGPETEFFELLERGGVRPLPEINVPLAPDLIPDALWRDHRVVAEIDDESGHGTSAQHLRDARRDMRYRELGFAALRYRPVQVRSEPDSVVRDVIRQLRAHAPGPP